MNTVSRRYLVLLVLIVGFTSGCGRKEISTLQRKAAAALVSEAQFALTLRDFARAEPLLAKATALCPDNTQYWQALGAVRRRMGNRAGAKDAYERMRDEARGQYRRDEKNTDALLQQVYALALLGRVDDARDALAKARRDHPGDRTLSVFADGRQFDRILEDPGFKELAL